MPDKKHSFVQRIVLNCLPGAWSDSIEKESREWIATCTCGHARSVWEMGGVRWKAAGEPSWKLPCPQCGETTWHKVSRSKS